MQSKCAPQDTEGTIFQPQLFHQWRMAICYSLGLCHVHFMNEHMNFFKALFPLFFSISRLLIETPSAGTEAQALNSTSLHDPFIGLTRARCSMSKPTPA